MYDILKGRTIKVHVTKPVAIDTIKVRDTIEFRGPVDEIQKVVIGGEDYFAVKIGRSAPDILKSGTIVRKL